MLLKKAKDSVGLVMSVNEIDISGKDILKILGYPHFIDFIDSSLIKGEKAEDSKHVWWIYKIFGIKIKIEYNASEHVTREYDELPQPKKIKTIKLKPLKNMKFGRILGERNMVKDFVIPYLHVLNDDNVESKKLYKMIKMVFEK
jgi:hypothetical protein